jgi:hypothetical protein
MPIKQNPIRVMELGDELDVAAHVGPGAVLAGFQIRGFGPIEGVLGDLVSDGG